MICKQGRSRFILKLYLVEVLHAPVDQELSGGNLNPSVEELESCSSENRHAANQVNSGYIIKETANQSVVAALFNRMQPYEKAPSRKRPTSITSGSGTSGSKKRKLSESEEGNI